MEFFGKVGLLEWCFLVWMVGFFVGMWYLMRVVFAVGRNMTVLTRSMCGHLMNYRVDDLASKVVDYRRWRFAKGDAETKCLACYCMGGGVADLNDVLLENDISVRDYDGRDILPYILWREGIKHVEGCGRKSDFD